jgi:glycerophosphoryl diester phosphodiesterase
VKLALRGVAAHRGGAAKRPENTCAAFREAARLGAHQIEFDVRRTADGEIAVLHDGHVDRTTDGHGALAQLRWPELRRVDAGAGERIPNLREALAAIPRDVWINVQVKEGEPIAAEVARQLADDGRLAQAFVSGDDATLVAARAAVAGVQVCSLSRQATRALYVEHALRLRAEFIQFHWLRGAPEPDLVERARAEGLRINFFCGPSDDVTALWRAGVDFPLVDDVPVALARGRDVGIFPLPR